MKTPLRLALLALAAGLAGCSQSGPSAGPGAAAPHKITIGLSLDTLKEARWQSDRDDFVARAGQLGANVLVLSANSDDSRQVGDVQSLISRGVDVLVIVPHNGEAMGRAVEMAKESNIPVIAYDRLIKNCDIDLYLSFDNVKVGEAQARYLVDHLPVPGHGKIIRIYGAPTDNNARMFKAGQDSVLAPYLASGKIQVIHEDWAEDWSPQNAKAITNAAITAQGSDFQGILASNDGTAGGAIQALKEEGLAGKVVVTGQDADLAALQRIVAGTQSMTVYKPVKQLAGRAAELAVDLARHRPVTTTARLNNGYKDVDCVFLPIVTVDKANLRATVITDGFHTAAEVYPAP